MAKPKVALYWIAGCGGCDVAVLDTNEKILDIANLVDIVLWPVALDFKYHHVEAMPDGSIDLALVNGAVRNTEHKKMVELLRAKSKVMVAFGSCAYLGGIPGLGNFVSNADIMKRVYQEIPSNANPEGTLPQTHVKVPEGELELPSLMDSVQTLAQVVKVEYFLPGCPPAPDAIMKLVELWATNKLPPPGAVVASDKSLCDECDRVKEEKKITRVFRSHQIIPDRKKCLLEQGLLCCGPATRGGCGQRCINANMPCRGCFGPPPGVVDQGAKLVSAIASIYQGSTPADIARMLDEVVDPAGTFYRFGLANSLLKRKRIPAAQGGTTK